jgi:hypothetical protein
VTSSGMDLRYSPAAVAPSLAAGDNNLRNALAPTGVGEFQNSTRLRRRPCPLLLVTR